MVPCFSGPAFKPIMSVLTHPTRRRVPIRSRPGRCAELIAAVWLALLTGCASERAIQRQEAAAPSLAAGTVASRPEPMLRPVGEAAPADSRCRAHDPTPRELAKQRSAIDPLRVPALYSELFYSSRSDPSAAMGVGGMRFRKYRQFDHPDSGLSGFVLLDDASGHALVLFKGMDRPFAEPDGWGGVFTDLGVVLAAKFGTGNGQFPRADDAYTEALCEEAVKSIELVGYSMGSQIANYLAVKYGAHGVVFGDMGLDAALLEMPARGDLQAARMRAREHIVSLSLSGDLVVKMFGVGEVVGTVVNLPGGLIGVFHQPEFYADAANAAIRDRERDGDREETAGAPPRAHAGVSTPDPGVTRNSADARGGRAAWP